MVHYLILCRSLTYAQRAARVLDRAGISAIVVRPPAGLGPHGCAYALRLRERALPAALRALRDAGLDHGKVYLLRPGGSGEEVSA